VARICLLGDTHIGARNDSQAFHDHFEKFYGEVFFPYLEANNIDTVVQFGDIFDRRKHINFASLSRSKKYFFEPLRELGITMHVFVGNHDTAFKNTNEVNSPDLLLGEYNNIHVYSEPEDIILGETKITLLPWVCTDNYDQCIDHIKTTDSQILFGHLELAGFEMHRGAMSDHGQFDTELLSKFDIVCSGHFHHRSSRGNIHYLGTPYEMSWSDYNDPKGFHIFDTQTRELEYIRNPYEMFQKWFYDDTAWLDFDEMSNIDYAKASGCYVKVVVKNKTNPQWLEMYIEKLEKAGAIDIQVIEDVLNLNLENTDDIIDEAEDTLTILRKVVDSVETNVSKKELDSFLTTLYSEALHQE
jgi:DNA repair exonuclease SbcCD nuclease subunit